MKYFLALVILMIGLFVAGCGPDNSRHPQPDCGEMGAPYTVQRWNWSLCMDQYK